MTDQLKRDLGADLEAELTAVKTRLFHLVDIEFKTATQYLSEAESVTFRGNNYLEASVKVNSFNWTPEGAQQGSISLLNENNAASAIALNEGVADVPIRIWITYFDGSTYTTPYLLVRGVLNTPQIRPSETTVTVLTNQALTEFVPRDFYIQENGFNHLVRSGDTITWMNEKFLLQAER